MTARTEYVRQLVHMAMGGFALALRYLTWWQAALLAGGAMVFNLFVLPHVGGKHLYRSSEFARGFPAGILLYPVSVLLLILVFPSRPDIAAAAWGILAVGDGMSTIVGRAVGRRPIPWNREKTWAGSLAFFVFGSMAGVALAWWCKDAVNPSALDVVLDRCADRGRVMRGGRRDRSGAARRQRLGAGGRSGGPVDGVVHHRGCRAHRTRSARSFGCPSRSG